ncbi:DinB family protein [Luteolibacter marinus]|uniref:DinB family protein n=1 Tax=Luteolibacter marinus TaxID=2776705 RepID=UPI0018673B10|nr:DinB family protein [Luteolibacter marinus]
MDRPSEPQLAAPGAGLPLPELYAARLLFRLQRWAGSRERFNDRFARERERIRGLVTSCEDSRLAARVLIPRPIGLEDSSRYWSVWMTLDHLRIIHQAFARVITALGQGTKPPGQASTAAVKPSPGADASAVADYEASCDALLQAVASVAELKTKTTFRHPWFGELDAYGWHGIAALHLGIHRVQIERILAGLHRS